MGNSFPVNHICLSLGVFRKIHLEKHEVVYKYVLGARMQPPAQKSSPLIYNLVNLTLVYK